MIPNHARFQAERAEHRARLHAAQGTTPAKPLSNAKQAKLAKIKEDDWRDTTLPPSQVFVRRLREYRKARGYTQEVLASRVTRSEHPISPDALSAIERNAKGLLVDDAFALIEALDTAPLYLFTPPAGKDLRLGGSVRVPAEHVREWLVAASRSCEPIASPLRPRSAMRSVTRPSSNANCVGLRNSLGTSSTRRDRAVPPAGKQSLHLRT